MGPKRKHQPKKASAPTDTCVEGLRAVHQELFKDTAISEDEFILRVREACSLQASCLRHAEEQLQSQEASMDRLSCADTDSSRVHLMSVPILQSGRQV